jgi:hypothetical protein
MRRALTSFFDLLHQRRFGTVSLERAFRAQRVTLSDPQSWSGVRADDGTVVIAIRRADVRSTGDGFSCLLWSPIAARRDSSDEPRMEERLAHCRLAALAGSADGLLVDPTVADVHLGSLVTIRVEKRPSWYWAKWGAAARFGARPPRAASWAGERMPIMAAA